MSKKGIFFLISLSCLSLCLSSVYAQQNTESITISTYYPSPYGNYHEMRAQRVAIGDNYIFGDQYCWAPEACITTIAPDADLVVEGRVGVGTVNPFARLHVEDADSGGNEGLRVKNTSPTGAAGIFLEQTRAGFPGGFYIRYWGGSAVGTDDDGQPLANLIEMKSAAVSPSALKLTTDGAPIIFAPRVHGAPFSEAMRITETGNVGIGTKSPISMLHIEKSVSAAEGQSGVAWPEIRINDPNSLLGNFFIRSVITDATYNTLQIGEEGAADYGIPKQVFMTLVGEASPAGPGSGYANPRGSVGIGTTHPKRLLHVVAPSGESIAARFEGGPGGHGMIEIQSPPGGLPYLFLNQDTSWSNVLYAASGSLYFRRCTGATGCTGVPGQDDTWMTILSGGNVGIGTPTPAYQLELSTDSAAKPTSDRWTISSDSRLKKNIQPLKGALAKMLRLRGITFQWKDPKKFGNMRGTYIGLIGQEVEDVFPEWVGTDAKGYKNLTVTGFEALTAEAIKELKAENEALKKRIEKLEARP